MTTPPPPDAIQARILALTGTRGPDKSICPSEVARDLHAGPEAEGWRALMTPVRQQAMALARAGRIEILRKGKSVSPEAVRGVIRLRIRAAGEPS